MYRFLLTYILFTTLFVSPAGANDRSDGVGNSRYMVNIEFGNAYLSGICIMQPQESHITASIINEFGVSALTFRYDTQKERIKIVSIVKPLSRGSVKRILKRDLKAIMKDAQSGNMAEEYNFPNRRFNIRYTFTTIEK